MAIPDYQTIMLPLLRLASDQQEHRFRDAVESLAQEFGLTDEERAELLPSGSKRLFNNRVGWARTYLKHAGLLESQRRGVFKVSAAGLELLQTNPDRIDNTTLEQYPEFIEFRTRRREQTDEPPTNPDGPDTQTPEDALASAYRKLRADIEGELLDTIKQASPSFFERLVIDVLVQMGYGGDRQDAAMAIGRSGECCSDRLNSPTIFVLKSRKLLS